MPIGIQRLNAHQTHPNDRIVFIKPLPGPTAPFAQDFLSRIAAICKPIMAAAHISVMTLEEHEPNPEFVGRNFNAGEIIQLVLKAPRTGNWLSFRSVQMVMMHELAHCIQMNHGRDFWKVRNQYASELRELWGKGYTGDGFWGRGKTTLSDQYECQGTWENEIMPERICGGTFRTRRSGKRKRGAVKTQDLTYAERKQRRIEKKFGKSGQALGGEEEVRVKLEHGNKPKGKPRVAGSSRGRELRAMAALARFGVQKEEEAKKEEMTGSGESETESDVDNTAIGDDAVDLNGSKLLDSKGQRMIKVCEDQEQNDDYVKQEMEELQGLSALGSRPVAESENHSHPTQPRGKEPDRETQAAEDGIGQQQNSRVDIKHENPEAILVSGDFEHGISRQCSTQIPPVLTKQTSDGTNTSTRMPAIPTTIHSCPICSLENEVSALVCVACSHVLQPRLIPGYWRCRSSTCDGSEFVNAGDCGRCGVCGGVKDGT